MLPFRGEKSLPIEFSADKLKGKERAYSTIPKVFWMGP